MVLQMETNNYAKVRHAYRPEIDGIRAFAVIAVIVNHFNEVLLPSGYLGVDIFFVISGFVITSSLSGRPSKDFNDFLTGFYTRRIKRLIPALSLFIVLSSFLICLFNPSPSASLKTGITSLFGLSNLYLLRQATDYFAASTELNIFVHTWSLGVEEQFYFLFPLLVWFTGFSRFTRYGARNLFYVMGALSVASLIAFVYLYQTNQPAAYFLMPTRLWEVGAGCLLFLSRERFSACFRIVESLPPWAIIGVIAVVLFTPLQFAVQATIAVVVMTMVLLTCLRSETATYRVFTYPPVVYIGLISYSLYLWHWSILALSRWTIGIHWWSVPFQFALILLLSIFSYKYVETPLRRSNWATVRWKSISYGIGVTISTALLLFALINTPNLSLYTGRSPSMAAVGVSSLNNPYLLAQTNSLWKGNECILNNDLEVGKKIAVEDCTLGSFTSAEKRIMVIGNSFSAAFIQAFDDIVSADRYSVTLTSSWGASPVKEVTNTSAWAKSNDYYWDSVVPSFINRLETNDWVFLISNMSAFTSQNDTSNIESLDQLKDGLEALSTKLSKKGVQLAVLHSIPPAHEANCQPVMAAKQWFTPFGSHCELPNRKESLLRRDKLNTLLVSLEAEDKLHIVDTFDVFCPEEKCTYSAKNGQVLYRDEYSHPSVEAARLASSIIREVLASE